jgi:hypothetical protein
VWPGRLLRGVVVRREATRCLAAPGRRTPLPAVEALFTTDRTLRTNASVRQEAPCGSDGMCSLNAPAQDVDEGTRAGVTGTPAWGVYDLIIRATAGIFETPRVDASFIAGTPQGGAHLFIQRQGHAVFGPAPVGLFPPPVRGGGQGWGCRPVACPGRASPLIPTFPPARGEGVEGPGSEGKIEN